MLIEFSVENFRSFSEKQTFTMAASARVADPETDQRRAVPSGNTTVPHVLLEACLFGANGAGKSALIEAVKFTSEFIENSFKDPHRIKRRVPFAFDPTWRKAPSEFEMTFIHEGSLFQYGFALDDTRILEEWLFERPNSTGRLRQLFTRAYDENKGAYDWDVSATQVKGERESWKTQTREDALFLTTAVHLNATSLERPFDWLVGGIQTIHDVNNMAPFTVQKIHGDVDWKTDVLEFLKAADVFLADILVQEVSFFEQENYKQLPNELKSQFKSLVPDDAVTYNIQSVRNDTAGNPIALPWEEESSGTQGLFALAGPILHVLEKGWTLIVDELNTSLHPLAFRYVTQLFCNPETNPHNAQLIFTTHDITVVDQDCISKDQVWMVEKRPSLASFLKPFSDYKTRDTSTFRKDYLNGRFGAIPRLAG